MTFLLGPVRKKKKKRKRFISFVQGDFAVYPGENFRKVLLKID